eukprot:Pompholyxophrys_sp_v1_NODE_133_length_1678_cov_1.174877.p2 type:complete len:252 gc:universal NODE_133_length_1678_cov_1.174877:781-26(-)
MVCRYFSDIKDFNQQRKNADESVGQIGSNLFSQLETSIMSLERLARKFPIEKTSIFGTNIVENFFSIIRRKVRYPNLMDYSWIFHRALMELIKHHSADFCFKYSDGTRKMGKKYNVQVGLSFSTADIKLWTKAEKKETKKQKQRISRGNNEERLFLKSLCEKYKCTNKRLLIREATCKTNPTITAKAQTKVSVHCPHIEVCRHMSPYKNEVSLRKHFLAKHGDIYHNEHLAKQKQEQLYKEKRAIENEINH